MLLCMRMGRLTDRVVCERELEGTVKPANDLEVVRLVLGGEDAVPDEKVEQNEDAIGLKVALSELVLDLASHQYMLQKHEHKALTFSTSQRWNS